MEFNRLELLNASFFEHRKFEEELAKIYGAAMPKRKIIAKAAEDIRQEILIEQNKKNDKKLEK